MELFPATRRPSSLPQVSHPRRWPLVGPAAQRCKGNPVMKRALSRAVISLHRTTVFLPAGGFVWAKEVEASSTVNQTVIRGLVTNIIRYPSGGHSI